MEDDFHVVLPSNGQEGNTPSEFLTNFGTPFRIENPNEWEVGLKEINFKNTIKTIDSDNAKVFTHRSIKKSALKNQALDESFVEWISFDNHKTPLHLDKATDFITAGKLINLSKLGSMNTEHFQFYFENGYIYYKNVSKFETTVRFPQIQMFKQMGFTEENFKYNFEGIKSQGTLRADKKAIITTTKKGISYVILQTVAVAKTSITSSKEIDSISLKLSDLQRQVDDHDNSMENAQDYKMYVHTVEPASKSFKYNISFKTYEVVKNNVTLKLKSGTYTDAKNLETELNKDDEFTKFFKFAFDQRLNRFDITTITKDKTATLHLRNGLNDVLGFTEKIISYSEEPQKSQLEVNLLRGITSLFVYCDAIAPIHVGTIMAPLLRTVSFNVKQYGEMIHVNYTNPIYLNLNKSLFNLISIKICDVVGELIPFAEGLSTVILHFRRKN